MKHTPAAVLGAYTGITLGPFGQIHDYICSLPGNDGIGTLGLTMLDREALKKEIRDRGDFAKAHAMLVASPDLLLACQQIARPVQSNVLDFVADRLVNVYGEKPSTDYIQALRIAAECARVAVAKAEV